MRKAWPPVPRGDRLERRHVEPRDDGVAALVALVAGGAALGVQLGHGLATLGADAHGEDDDARLLGPLHRLLDLARQVLAVRDQHHRLVAAVLVDEGLEPFREAGPERRAGRGHDAGLDGLQEQAERVGVERQRDERVGLALERHEREAVALEPGDELQERLACQEEPARRDVCGRHRAGGVEHQHDVLALALHLLAHDAPLRPRERQDHAGGAEEQQGEPQPDPARAGAPHDPTPERAGDQGREPRLVAPGEPGGREAGERQREQGEEPRGGFEDHARHHAQAARPRAGRPRRRARPRPRARSGRAPGSGGKPRA